MNEITHAGLMPSSKPCNEAGLNLGKARPQAGDATFRIPGAVVYGPRNEEYSRLFPVHEVSGSSGYLFCFSYVEDNKIKFTSLYEQRMAGHERLRLIFEDGVMIVAYDPCNVCWQCERVFQHQEDLR